MIKGGFQGLDISGVDLTAQSPTLPGAYEACEAAGGKPVRVLTSKGQVTCSIELYSSNYLLAGVTGDGKILSIVVDGNDAIQVSEKVAETEATKITVIGRGNTEVDLLDYSDSNPYIAEHDGVVILSYNNGISGEAGDNLKVYIKGIPASPSKPLGVLYFNSTEAVASATVKKGMAIYGVKTGTANGNITLYRFMEE